MKGSRGGTLKRSWRNGRVRALRGRSSPQRREIDFDLFERRDARCRISSERSDVAPCGAAQFLRFDVLQIEVEDPGETHAVPCIRGKFALAVDARAGA